MPKLIWNSGTIRDNLSRAILGKNSQYLILGETGKQNRVVVCQKDAQNYFKERSS